MYDFLQYIAQHWGLIGILLMFPLIALIVVSSILIRVIRNLENDMELTTRSIINITDNVVSTQSTIMVVLRMLTDVLVGVSVLISQDEDKEAIAKDIQANMQRYLNGKFKERGE